MTLEGRAWRTGNWERLYFRISILFLIDESGATLIIVSSKSSSQGLGFFFPAFLFGFFRWLRRNCVKLYTFFSLPSSSPMDNLAAIICQQVPKAPHWQDSLGCSVTAYLSPLVPSTTKLLADVWRWTLLSRIADKARDLCVVLVDFWSFSSGVSWFWHVASSFVSCCIDSWMLPLTLSIISVGVMTSLGNSTISLST